MYKLEKLNEKKIAELQDIAQELNIKKFNNLNKKELTYAILDHQAENTKMTGKIGEKQKSISKPPKNEKKEILKSQPKEQKDKKEGKVNSDQNNEQKSARIESYFWDPTSVVIDNKQNLLILDSNRNRIQVYKLN